MRAVPEDEEEGLDIEVLERGLKTTDAEEAPSPGCQRGTKSPRRGRKIYRHVVYAVLTFANPSGKLMSLARREALVRLARRHEALIITDDVYDMLQWGSSPESEPSHLEKAGWPRVVDVDRYFDGGPVTAYGNAVSNGSFSKIAGPGNRTGWAEATEEFIFGYHKRRGPSSTSVCQEMLKIDKLTIEKKKKKKRKKQWPKPIRRLRIPAGNLILAPSPPDLASGIHPHSAATGLRTTVSSHDVRHQRRADTAGSRGACT